MEYCSNIPNYSDELVQCMYSLQQNGTSCDASLQCKDGTVAVHKVVLLSCKSPYLTQILSSNTQQGKTFINLNQFSMKTVYCLVQTIYTGEIKLKDASNIVEFVELCNFLGLSHVIETLSSLGLKKMQKGGSDSVVTMVTESDEVVAASGDHSYDVQPVDIAPEDQDMVINEKTGVLEKRAAEIEDDGASSSKKLKLDEEEAYDLLSQTAATSQEDKDTSPLKGSLDDPEINIHKASEVKRVAKEKKKAEKTAAQLKKDQYREKITEAYEAVMSKKMTLRQAVKVYNIPDGTLRDRVKGKKPVVVKAGLPSTLDDAESDKLATHLTKLFKLGYNYSIEDLCTLSSQYAVGIGKRSHTRPVTKHWFYTYAQNYPVMQEVRSKVQRNEKNQIQDTSYVSNFASFYSKNLTKHGLTDHPEVIYSLTCTEVTYEVPFAVRTVPTVKDTVTIFMCANAAGEVLTPYYVFSEETDNDVELNNDCKPGAGFIAEEKLFSSEIFLHFLKNHFLKNSPKDRQKILLIDGHNLYFSLEVFEWTEANNVTLVLLPADSSETHQPLEIEGRKAFEKLFADTCMAKKQNKLNRKSLCQAVSVAYNNVFTEYEVKKAFRESGVFPLQTKVLTSPKIEQIS